MHITLVKADQSQRLVTGRIDETPDRAGEVFDYTSSKPNFEKWSSEQAVASGGKSLGNVRVMHKAEAAGVLTDIQYDDATKAIIFTAHVVDDDAWGKVEKGVFTGFSPGGKYAKRWKDGVHVRYTAEPNEMSLVDRPCISSASFTMVKADGAVEELSFDYDIMAKAGARHSQADLSRIQAIRDHADALLSDHAAAGGGGIGGGPANKADQGGDLAKLQGDLDLSRSTLAKVQGDLALAHGDLAKLQGELKSRDDENANLKDRVAKLEAAPSSGGPALHAVDKAADAMLNKADQPNAPDGTGTFEQELAKVQAMPPGPEKAEALKKVAGLAVDTNS